MTSTFYSGSTCESSDSFFDWSCTALDFGSSADFDQDYKVSGFPKAKQFGYSFNENFTFEEYQAEDLDIPKANTVLEESKKIQKKPAKTRPIPKASKKSDSNRKRNLWTVTEDEQLLHFMSVYGSQWAKIASHIPNRTGKQVRDRYLSALVSNINRNAWTEEEDRTILRMLEEMGPQWCRIAEALDNRTDIQVKNRYNTYLKKNGVTCSAEVTTAEASPKAADMIFSEEEPDFAEIDYEQLDLSLNRNCF